mgnify:CR=1 FL=1
MNRLKQLMIKKRTIIIIVLCIIIFTGPFIFYFSVFSNGVSNDYNSWGSFGSYVGGVVSSIFSFASFLAVLYSFNLSNKEKISGKEEKRIFQFLDLLKETRTNLYYKMNNTQEYKGEQVVIQYSGWYSDVSFATQKYRNGDTHINGMKITPANNGLYFRYIFLREPLESFMKIIKFSYEYIMHLKALNMSYYFELVSAVLTNQDKQAFMYYEYDFLEKNDILQKYFYKNEKGKETIKNMKNIATEYIKLVEKSLSTSN